MMKLTWLVLGLVIALGATTKSAQEQVLPIVTQIQRADYEGNRAALLELYRALEPYEKNETIASRVAYWRGFALWRRALNGFNDKVPAQELAQDLQQALSEFQKSSAADPNFIDADVGAISCLSNLMFLNRNDSAKTGELVAQAAPLTKKAKAADADNPRLLWVLGANQWYAPPERGGGQEKAIATYEKGLEIIRKQQTRSGSPLDPSWGEPELLMNLSWSNLNKTPPDVKVAHRDAQAALTLVPYWHYVRDILMPQIQAAAKANP